MVTVLLFLAFCIFPDRHEAAIDMEFPHEGTAFEFLAVDLIRETDGKTR